MRTTLALDDDVAALLQHLRAKRKTNLRTVVNEALRRGLLELGEPRRPRATYQTPAVKLGRCLIGDLDDIGEALAAAEGERFG